MIFLRDKKTLRAWVGGCSPLGRVRAGGYLSRGSFTEPFQVRQVLRATGGALHREEMIEPAHAHWYALDVACERFPVQRGVQVVRLDPADPLKDVQATQVRGKAKVASLRQVLHARRGHRELLWIEVAGFLIDRIDIRKRRGKSLEVLMHRIWDHIEILRGPHVAVSTDRKPADRDVLDTVFLQVPQQRDRIKRLGRSEERRVGKECRSRWSPYH